MRNSYATLVFDCDGVVLNSNAIKTGAFAQVAAPYGAEAAAALVTYHVQNGGISRFEKLRYFQTQILGRPHSSTEIEQLCDAYGARVFDALLTCDVAPGLRHIRKSMPNVRWMIVSGGAGNELNEVFATRGLLDLFDGGIHGSPASKDEIFERELASGRLARPAIYFGDSEYDHRAATRAEVAFVFVSGWSEFGQLDSYCRAHQVTHRATLAEAVNFAFSCE